jgi:hypothetical protein
MRILARTGVSKDLSAAVCMQRDTFVVDIHNFSIFHGGKTLGVKTASCMAMTIYKAHTVSCDKVCGARDWLCATSSISVISQRFSGEHEGH